MCKFGEVATEKCVSLVSRDGEMREALDRRDGEMCKFGEVATQKCVSFRIATENCVKL